ncbi:TrbI/VirB10 family protein [Qipengyuania flava]|jgi:type IV secretion system protein VirB10|uniref:TrbI/VirB10 family protein n=1 Tax=Qipengyuania flava TaxID=192812 RepID=UPI001CD4AE13|nr:TrbI/VirB10 family protein [Qipengyuania flava]MCA0891166.1 type VI secretion protein [Qipengyuania flava]
MRLAMRLPEKKPGDSGVANDIDPREDSDAEVIDLAQRNAFPAVARPAGKSDALGMVAGIAIVAGLGLVTLWSMNSTRVAQPEGIGGQQAPVAAAPAVAPEAVTPPTPAAAAPAQVARPDPAPQPVLAAQPQPGLAANPYANPTVVYDAGTSPATLAVAEPGAAGEAAGGSTGNPASDFASRIGGVGGAPAQARAMVNPATTVTQGTLIPAILETAIDTNVPGYVRAVVSQDVRSFDGTKVLVPRSSRLIGQYQSGLQNGQKRAYVIWTRLIRPDGASVNLASPAIGFDGTTGLAGKVSGNSFFKRFGSAMLLSVVGGVGSLATGGAAGVLIGGASSSAAATAAQQDGQRGPTVRVRQGEPIRIFTARDLDFSTVS